jgi:integrase
VRTAAPGRYGDGNGLYLLVRSPEARFWIFRYTIAGRMREMGLGRAGADAAAVPLAEARAKAAELHRAVRAGADPLQQRAVAEAAARAAEQEAAIRSITFTAVADRFLAAHEAGWRNPKHQSQWRNTLQTYAHPHVGELPVADVDTVHVLSVLEPIWHKKPESASRLRGRLEAVLDYAKVRGWREGENPARWRGHLDHLLPSRAKLAPVEHHAALPWGEIGAFVARLREQPGMAARALEFAILTAARTGEALGATWAEIDMGAAVWTVPAARMKAKKEHRVPLSEAALAVLRAMAELRTMARDRRRGCATHDRLHEADHPSAYVFPGARPRKPLSIMAMAMVLRRMDRGDLTVHGFRSTFRDWAAEATSYAREVAEAALAHALSDKVEAAYRRGDLFEKRKRLMAEWAAFCERPVIAAGEVIPLRKVAE